MTDAAKPAKILPFIVSFLCAVSLVLIALYVAVCIPTFSMRFYEREFEKNGTYARVRMEREDLREVTRHMIDYMRGKTPDLNIMTRVNGEERLFFSQIEIDHMVDVQFLFTLLINVRRISVCVVLAAAGLFIWAGMFRERRRLLLKTIMFTALSVIALLGLITLIGVLNFEFAFEWFHLIFFDNDNWILDPRVDLLINIVPLEFFIDAAVLLGIIFGAGLILTVIIPFILLRKKSEI